MLHKKLSKILKTSFYLYSYLTDCLVGSFLEVGVYLSNFRSKSSKNKPPEYWIKRKHTSTLCPLKSVCIFDERLRIFFPRIILFWKSLIPLCQWASKSCWKPQQNVSLGTKYWKQKLFVANIFGKEVFIYYWKPIFEWKVVFQENQESWIHTTWQIYDFYVKMELRYFLEIQSLLFFPRLDQPL